MVTPYPLAPGAPAIAFWVVYAVAFGPDALRTLREDDPAPDTIRDAGSKYVIAACNAGSYALAVTFALVVPGTTIRPARPAVFACGLTVTLAGAVIRWYAIRTLADAFSTTVAVERDHSVVETGPYRWVRHPSYTGGMLMFLGLALALQAREVFRPDLRVLVMSATLDTGPIAGLVDDAPLIQSEGRSYPVEVHYADQPISPGDRLAPGQHRATTPSDGGAAALRRGASVRHTVSILTEKTSSRSRNAIHRLCGHDWTSVVACGG